MKKFLIILAFISLSGCQLKGDNDIPNKFYSTSDFTTSCLDGIEYWTRQSGEYNVMFAVRIDRETKLPKECNE